MTFGVCSAHPGAACRMTSCVWCGRGATPVSGAYLEALYPGRTTCDGCGRLQLNCECEPTIPESELRAMDGNR